MTNISVAASVPFTIAAIPQTTNLDTLVKLRTQIGDIANALTAATTILISPDDQTEEGVTISRGIMDRENKNGATDGVASITRLGLKASLSFNLSRDIPALDSFFFRPETIDNTTNPDYLGYGDKAGLTTGLCADAQLIFVVAIPHLCGGPTTLPQQMMFFPWCAARATNAESRGAINTQYQVSGLSFEALACPYTGDLKGKHRFYRVLAP